MLLRRFEALVDPYPDGSDEPLPARFGAFVWACTHGVRRYLAAVTLFTACIGAFEAVLFSMMAHVVDLLGRVPKAELWRGHGGTLALLGAALVASIAFVVLQALFKYQGVYSAFPMRLRWRFHRVLLAQSLSFFQDEFAGRIGAKVMQTALAVRDSCLVMTDILVYVVTYFVTLIVVLAAFDAWLVVPFVAWLVAYVGALCWFVPRLGRVGQAQADARSLMTGRMTDAYGNIGTVKLFSHAHGEAHFARGAMQEFMVTAQAQMRLVSGFEIVNQVLSVALIGSTALLSLRLWGLDLVSVGAVAAASAMAFRLNGMSHWVMWEMASLFEHIGTVQDGLRTLSKPRAVLDRPGAQPLAVARGEVRFDGVVFAYGGERRVVDRLDLTIRAGEKIGLVGRSGAGKSTVVNLLLRLHDVESGAIRIDGQDIAGVTQDSLRRQVGMVTQDTSLLHRSVRDNIVYGRPEATEAEMRHAAARAEAADFVLGLTDPQGRRGFDAHVGERGVKLSGGQRQRIAIARVMLKDAPILLLDEATSALDSEVETAIQRSLYRLMEGKTVIAIAHRLSTIAAMDRLVVMEQGRIAEQGTHAELLAAGGIYARLWAHQTGGFLGEEADADADGVAAD